MRQIIGMILIILFFSCARIENREWKYHDGFSIGDWIEFDDVGLTIRNDTIFNKENLLREFTTTIRESLTKY